MLEDILNRSSGAFEARMAPQMGNLQSGGWLKDILDALELFNSMKQRQGSQPPQAGQRRGNVIELPPAETGGNLKLLDILNFAGKAGLF